MTKQALSSKRWWIWFPVLLLAAWLAVFGDKTPVQTSSTVSTTSSKSPLLNVRPSSNTQMPNGPANSQMPVALLELVPRQLLIPPLIQSNKTSRDLFTDRSWTPAPKPVIAPPPPPPTAPPLPFTYVGKRLEAEKWQVFLARADQTFVVSTGSTIDNLYRVDAISPPNLNLTYLPLGQSQSIAIGEAR